MKEKGEIVIASSVGKIKRVFGKELSRRRFTLDESVFTKKMLECDHEWIHEISCGEKYAPFLQNSCHARSCKISSLFEIILYHIQLLNEYLRHYA